MESESPSNTYSRILDFLVEKATPEAILAYKLPQEEQDLAAELLEKQDEDRLTAEEYAVLEQMAEVDLLMSALRLRALKVLGKL